MISCTIRVAVHCVLLVEFWSNVSVTQLPVETLGIWREPNPRVAHYHPITETTLKFHLLREVFAPFPFLANPFAFSPFPNQYS